MQLKNICDVFSGYAFKSFNTEEEGTPIIKIGNINNDGTIDLHNCQYSTEEPNKKYKSKNGDIYIALSGATTGKIGLMKSDNYYINQRVGIVRIKDLKVPVDYLLFFLQSKTKKILSDAAGAAQPNISPKDIAKYEISIPSEEKMISISKELNLISRTIVLKQNKLLSLDELIKSRFVEMFGDVFSRKSKFKTKKIGELVISKVERASKYFDSESEIKYIDISSIDNSNNVITGYTQYFMKDAPSRAQQHVKKHDILISTVRPNLNNVAKVQYDFDNLVASSGFCVLRSTEIEPEYLFSFVSRNEFANYLSSLTTGASYPAVSDKDILNIEIPYPPKDKQLEFVNFHRQVDKSKFVCYSKYFLWLNFTFVSSTIAYSNVVSILEWPNRCWTCSIGIPLSMAFVANVLLNLCGCTLSNPIFLPIFRSIISTPLISSLSYGFKRLTKRASLSSFLESKYCCKCIFVFASKYTFRCLFPLPKTIHSLFSKSISLISNLTSSPTLIPVDIRTSIIAKSRLLFADCFINSIVSSEYTSFTTFPVFTLWILLHGLFEI